VDAPLRVRWALLFHDAGKPEAAWVGKDGRKHYYAARVPLGEDGRGEYMSEDHEVVSERLWREAAERMNVPRELREDVARLIRNHMVPCTSKIKRTKVHRMRVKYGDEFLSDLFLHRMCDLTGKGKANRQHMANVAAAELLRKEAQTHNVPSKVKDLEVGGKEAKEAGLEGAAIGTALMALLDEVVVDPSFMKLSYDWQLERLGALAA
jgi:hypothetical protein